MKVGTPETWIGMANVIPSSGSAQENAGLRGGYGLIVFQASNVSEGVSALFAELLEGGSTLVGFEWLRRLGDSDRKLTDLDTELIERSADYPVQFHDFHWHTED